MHPLVLLAAAVAVGWTTVCFLLTLLVLVVVLYLVLVRNI